MTNGPLVGMRVVVTRAEHQAAELQQLLRAQGAEVVRFPTIALVDPADKGAALRAAVSHLENYDWLLFTSANAVERVEPLLRSFLSCKLAAIGGATLHALEDLGISVDLVPDEAIAESLLAALLEQNPTPAHFLLPRAAVARDVLPDGLRAAGHTVDVVEAYQTVAAEPDSLLVDAVRAADLITFTSSSTVEQFVALVPDIDRETRVACIGPVTASTAREHGFTQVLEATEHSALGLVRALIS